MSSFHNNNLLFYKLINYISCLIVPFFIVLRDVIGFEIPKLIFILICGFTFLLLDFNGILCFLAFLFSMMSGLPANYILLLAYIVLIIKKKTRFHILQFVLPIWVMIIELFHIWDVSSIDIVSLISYIVHIGIISLIVFDCNESLDYKKIVIMFCIGVLIMLFILLAITLKFTTIENMISGKIRFGNITYFLERNYNMVLTNNQNNIAYYCVLAISAEISLAAEKNKHLLYSILICITLFFGVLTMSKTFLVVMAVIVMIMIFVNYKWSMRNCISLFAITAMLLLFYYNNINLFLGLFNNIMYRFYETSFLNGRIEIFSLFSAFLYHNIFYFIFGTGVLNMEEITGISSSPHCGFQQIGIAYGILGFLIFIIGLIKMIQNANRGVKCEFIYYSTMIVMFIFTQSIQFINPYELMMPIIIGFCTIRLGSENVV